MIVMYGPISRGAVVYILMQILKHPPQHIRATAQSHMLRLQFHR